MRLLHNWAIFSSYLVASTVSIVLIICSIIYYYKIILLNTFRQGQFSSVQHHACSVFRLYEISFLCLLHRYLCEKSVLFAILNQIQLVRTGIIYWLFAIAHQIYTIAFRPLGNSSTGYINHWFWNFHFSPTAVFLKEPAKHLAVISCYFRLSCCMP